MKTPSLRATIKALRALHYSQDAIAKEARVSQMTISRWERKDPKLVNVAALNRLIKFLEKVSSEKDGQKNGKKQKES